MRIFDNLKQSALSISKSDLAYLVSILAIAAMIVVGALVNPSLAQAKTNSNDSSDNSQKIAKTVKNSNSTNKAKSKAKKVEKNKAKKTAKKKTSRSRNRAKTTAADRVTIHFDGTTWAKSGVPADFDAELDKTITLPSDKPSDIPAGQMAASNFQYWCADGTICAVGNVYQPSGSFETTSEMGGTTITLTANWKIPNYSLTSSNIDYINEKINLPNIGGGALIWYYGVGADSGSCTPSTSSVNSDLFDMSDSAKASNPNGGGLMNITSAIGQTVCFSVHTLAEKGEAGYKIPSGVFSLDLPSRPAAPDVDNTSTYSTQYYGDIERISVPAAKTIYDVCTSATYSTSTCKRIKSDSNSTIATGDGGVDGTYYVRAAGYLVTQMNGGTSGYFASEMSTSVEVDNQPYPLYNPVLEMHQVIPKNGSYKPSDGATCSNETPMLARSRADGDMVLSGSIVPGMHYCIRGDSWRPSYNSADSSHANWGTTSIYIFIQPGATAPLAKIDLPVGDGSNTQMSFSWPNVSSSGSAVDSATDSYPELSYDMAGGNFQLVGFDNTANSSFTPSIIGSIIGGGGIKTAIANENLGKYGYPSQPFGYVAVDFKVSTPSHYPDIDGEPENCTISGLENLDASDPKCIESKPTPKPKPVKMSSLKGLTDLKASDPDCKKTESIVKMCSIKGLTDLKASDPKCFAKKEEIVAKNPEKAKAVLSETGIRIKAAIELLVFLIALGLISVVVAKTSAKKK
ncbi:MAG: hypothetical protein LBM13_01570 [Candidatus Ancillula sp.]|nr:hypothetical protein [Candidatus Ancillula sp.]